MGDGLGPPSVPAPAPAATAVAAVAAVAAAAVAAVAAAAVAAALRAAEVRPLEAVAILDRVEAGVPAGDRRLQGMVALARGRAELQLGHRRSAGAHLRRAVDLLGGAGEAELAAGATLSLALERIEAAEFDEAIELIDGVSVRLSGREAARALHQKALALQRSGRVVDSVEAWDRAVDAFGAAGMPVEQAVARQNRGIVHIYRDDLPAAAADLRAALATFDAAGEEIRAAEATHNLGFVATRRADIPAALRLYDEAQSRAARLGTVRPQMLVDRVEATLDAGLYDEGRRLAEAAVRRIEEAGFDADLPEACLLASRACTLDGRGGEAAAWAVRAGALFGAQGRHRWELLAALAGAMAERGPDPEAEAADLLDLGRRLRASGWPDAGADADVEAVRRLVAVGNLARAEPVVAALVAGLGDAGLRGRLQVRLVQADLAVAAGDGRRARRALVSAVRGLHSYQATLGSMELRRHAGGFGEEIAATGVRLAVAGAAPEWGLWALEAVRSARRAPADGQAADPELMAMVQSLREVSAALAADPLRPGDAARLRRRQAAVEELVRRRNRQRPGGPAAAPRPVGPVELVARLGDRVLVEYACSGPRLVAVVVTAGSIRIVGLGSRSDAQRMVAGLRLRLRSAVVGDPSAAVLADLAAVGRAAAAELWAPLEVPAGRPVVIVPDGPLASVPWALLAGLEDREITVCGSATAWARHGAVPGHPGKVLLVAGPDLRHATAEVEELAALWPGATVLSGGDATVAQVLSAARHADLVHVAAHASHRGDNPLLSGIRLADGHVTGHELATAGLSASLAVLSCCDTGMADTSSGLGLAQLLTDSGVATAVASVSPLADLTAGPLMVALHRRLVAGVTPARALAAARAEVGGAEGCPSAAGLVCFGTG